MFSKEIQTHQLFKSVVASILYFMCLPNNSIAESECDWVLQHKIKLISERMREVQETRK